MSEVSGGIEVFDVISVGLGPGGESAATQLAEGGLSVVAIEAELVGGECPYWGCIPSKMAIRAANLLAEGRRIPGMAGESTITADYAPVAARIRDEATDDWNDQVAVDRIESKGVTFVRGRGVLAGPTRVTVGDRIFEARRAILLNTGTKPFIPPVRGLAETPFWDNRGAIAATEVPASLAVIGGGAIGVELGQVFARFGAHVTIVEDADRILAMEEPQSSVLLTDAFRAEGIDVLDDAHLTGISHDGSVFHIAIAGRDDLVAERLLVATGRRPDLASLGVAAIGLDESAHSIPVDGRLRAAPGVWAIGDVTGKGAFTHVSMYQAAIAAKDILGQDPDEADYRALPRVTFTDPEVGSVGMTEADARQAGLDVDVGISDVAKSARGWIHKVGNAGLIKLVVDTKRGVLVGATSAGPTGGEVLSLLALAVHAEVPISSLRSMIYAYPTFHRAIEDALGDLAENASGS
jgi:pyruvate/2-oxoglutarate dehydrogenase complex dihydrolipoamide dehydrogenase (E3) component